MYQLTRLTEAHAAQICAWAYPPPYDIYNWKPWELLLAGEEEFADPAIREAQYRAVLDGEGTLCGYAQFFPIVGTTRLGFGMRPDLCGLGRGEAFVRAIVQEARRQQPDNAIDLEVLTWNHRAIRAYRRAGFRIDDTYVRGTREGEAEFHCMVWQGAELPSGHSSSLPHLA